MGQEQKFERLQSGFRVVKRWPTCTVQDVTENKHKTLPSLSKAGSFTGAISLRQMSKASPNPDKPSLRADTV